MELKLKTSKTNSYPLTGFFIRGQSLADWLTAIQQLNFSLNDIKIYALPGNEANSIWGCLVSTNQPLKNDDVGKYELSQRVFSNLFIPEKSKISPYLSDRDAQLLFVDHLYVFHPETGLAVCEKEISLDQHIAAPKELSRTIIKPVMPTFIPSAIKSFQVKAVENKDPLAALEKDAFPKKEKMPDDGLNMVEHVKLKMYKLLFDKSKNKDGEDVIDKTPLGDLIDTFLKSTTNNNKELPEKFLQDFEELDKRNQKQIDKLLELLKNNPEEALKYAIPLDPNQSSRGHDVGRLDLLFRWGSFNLFGNETSGSSQGGAVNLGDHFDLLSRQYHQTAKDLMDKGEYEKAAFVYLKLLKDYDRAAKCLKEGKLYQEAAMIYLTYLKNKVKAAECFEQGNMFEEAIDIHDELKNFEKAGDLSTKIGNENDALKYYSKAVEVFINSMKYKAAGDLLYNKVGDIQRAQSAYLEGWNNNRDAHQCLALYFENMSNLEKRKAAIETIYAENVSAQNVQTFIKVIQKEFKERNKLADFAKEFSYKIMAEYAGTNPMILDEIRVFTPEDNQVGMDISRYRRRQ